MKVSMRKAVRWAGVAAPGLWTLSSGNAWADWQLNMHVPVTEAGRRAYELHNDISLVCLAIFALVFGILAYSLVKHRKSKGHQAAEFHEHLGIEIAWTIVPVIILVLIAIPATKTLVEMKDTSEPELTVKVTGYQWKWGYDYLKGEGEGIKFLSVMTTPLDQIHNKADKTDSYMMTVDNPLVVPVNTKVRILTTANDVIHSWAVPAFAVKQDAVPGFIRDTWFKADKEGTYNGQCSELCGKDHGYMPIVVKVVSAGEYSNWVAEQKKKAAAGDDPNKTWTLDEAMARGEKVYNANCAACHQASGQGIPGTFPPLDGAKIAKSPAMKGKHIETVLHGRPGTAMAAFGAQLSDTEIATVITYERNAWSNKTGEVIQPADVKAAR
ncbi:MAG TPA: cytochrome c oxidase subunit II [Rhodocyclaceae bacterium]|nr:cytochrome c oxidase subunit II [Rhodocyclaceae bacterium]